MKWRYKLLEVNRLLRGYFAYLENPGTDVLTMDQKLGICQEIERQRRIKVKIEAMPYALTLNESNDYEIEINSKINGKNQDKIHPKQAWGNQRPVVSHP